MTLRNVEWRELDMKSESAPAGRMHRARDGTGLYVEIAEPEAKARGSILLTHGMGEHLGRYGHVVPVLTGLGLRVVCWDLRGHGRSEGARGDLPSYQALVEDLGEIWDLTKQGAPPWYLYGHSLGGQITLNFALQRNPEAAGMVITSPWLRLEYVPPWWKVLLARVMVRVWPAFAQDTDMRLERLSRDMVFLNGMPNPELVHQRMSARMYLALMQGAAEALEDGPRLRYPMLLIHGSKDPVTSAAASEKFYGTLASEDKSLVIVPDALHETHNDLCRDTVLRQIADWLAARLPRPL
jgi:acylglycerol lipase